MSLVPPVPLTKGVISMQKMMNFESHHHSRHKLGYLYSSVDYVRRIQVYSQNHCIRHKFSNNGDRDNELIISKIQSTIIESTRYMRF